MCWIYCTGQIEAESCEEWPLLLQKTVSDQTNMYILDNNLTTRQDLYEPLCTLSSES